MNVAEKLYTNISQSAASSRSLNKNDQRCLSATLAVDVMLSLGLASAFELPFGQAIKLVQKPFFDFTLGVFFFFLCFAAKHQEFVGLFEPVRSPPVRYVISIQISGERMATAFVLTVFTL